MVNRDIQEFVAAEGSYRDIRNAVLQQEGGDKATITSEPGTTRAIDLGGELAAELGKVKLGSSSGEVVLFYADNSIRLFSPAPTPTLTILYQSDDLAFGEYVKARYHLQGCNRIVHFVDAKNRPRYIDVDKALSGTYPTDVSDLLLQPSYKWTDGEVIVENGGSLFPGAYNVSVRYSDVQGASLSQWFEIGEVQVFAGGEGYDDRFGIVSPDINPGETYSTKSNKAITVSLTNPDLNFTHYQIAFVEYTLGSGVARTATETPPVAIGGSFTYSDNQSQGTTEIPAEQVLFTNLRFGSAAAVEIVQDRLLLANTSELDYDWCSLFSAVLQITAKPVLKTQQIYSTEPGSAKHYDLNSRGYMGGEIALFGVVPIVEGQQGPVFPIIPPKGPIELQQLSIAPGDFGPQGSFVGVERTRPLGETTIGDLIPRWRVENAGNSERFGYYESTNATYPTSEICDGSPMYGGLAGTPVRYFRFPDRGAGLSAVSSDVATIFGVEFDGINFPPEVEDYYFVRLDIGPNLIEGKAAMFGSGIDPEDANSPTRTVGRQQEYVRTNQGDPTGFHWFTLTAANRDWSRPFLMSPEISLNGDTPTTPTVRLEYPLSPRFKNFGFNERVTELAGFSLDDEDIVVFPSYAATFQAKLYAPLPAPEPRQFGVTPMLRMSPRQAINDDGLDFFNDSYELTFALTNSDQIEVKAQTDLFSYLEGYMVALENTSDKLQDITSAPFTRISRLSPQNNEPVFGGDTWVAPMQVSHHLYKNTINSLFGDPQIYFQQLEHLELPIETRLNPALRVDVDPTARVKQGLVVFDPNNPPNTLYTRQDDLASKYIRRFGAGDSEATLATISSANPALNEDYSLQESPNDQYTLPLGYDCCDNCLNSNPYRVHASSVSLADATILNFRNFAPLDFVDIASGSAGAVIDLCSVGNQLYVLAADDIFRLPFGGQERVVDDLVTYVGTGDIFGVNPLSYNKAILRWDPTATTPTPWGTLCFDSGQGTMYLLEHTGQVRDITPGLQSFFEPRANPNDKTKVLAAYDHSQSRILMSVEYPSGEKRTLSFNQSGVDGFGGWIFHDYTINSIFASQGTLWTIFGTFVYKHGSDSNLYIHDAYRKFLVSSVHRLPRSTGRGFTLDSIDWRTRVLINGAPDSRLTYTRFWARNSYQSTYFTNIGDGLNYDLRKEREVWHLNGFRDQVVDINQPIVLSEPPTGPQDQPNTSNLGDRPWYNREPLTDEYVIIVLEVNPIDIAIARNIQLAPNPYTLKMKFTHYGTNIPQQ